MHVLRTVFSLAGEGHLRFHTMLTSSQVILSLGGIIEFSCWFFPGIMKGDGREGGGGSLTQRSHSQGSVMAGRFSFAQHIRVKINMDLLRRNTLKRQESQRSSWDLENLWLHDFRF